jgi:hypothetical protein
MRFAFLTLLALASPMGWAAGPYEGSWFTCVFEMAGRVNPWSVQTIGFEEGELKVLSEWGTKYSFSGSARVEGTELVIRGCSYYVDQPMNSCDPDNPPAAGRLKLPLHKTPPSNLDAALKRGESIFLSSSAQFERLSRRCENLIEAEAARKESQLSVLPPHILTPPQAEETDR